MRLWHKNLIPYLPRQQLIAQWRECCAIAGNIAKKGKPNHILVNKVLNYPPVHFLEYTRLIIGEFLLRNYIASDKSIHNFVINFEKFGDSSERIIIDKNTSKEFIFKDWHNKRYLLQCLANLSEKYDCGRIPEDEWDKIKSAFPEQMKILYQE